MAENIVGSLFGVDPQQLAQQRQATDFANAYRVAQLDPLEQAKMSIYQGGAGLARGVQGLLGGDAEMQKASKIQELSSQFDLSTPQGARDFGRALQPFAPVESMKALTKADAMEQSQLTRQKTQADITLQERKVTQDEKLREALAALPENATDAQYLQVYRQYGNPDQQAKAIELAAARRERLAAKTAGDGGFGGERITNNGIPRGVYDKTGRYRAPTGEVYSAAKMDKAQEAHDKAASLLDKLEGLSEADINAAYGSVADYTTTVGGKLLGPTATYEAQNKINEVGIAKVLDNLSSLKGAASDKDMAQMIKDFPGYQAAPDVMKRWVDRAVKTTNNFLSKSEKRYGFDTEYGTEGRFSGKTTKEAGPAQGGKVKTRTLKSGVVVTEE